MFALGRTLTNSDRSSHLHKPVTRRDKLTKWVSTVGGRPCMITDVKLTEASPLKHFLIMLNLLLARAPDVSSVAISCVKQDEQSSEEMKMFFLYKQR